MADFEDVVSNEQIAAIADAIRHVTRTSGSMTIPQMPERLSEIRATMYARETVELHHDANEFVISGIDTNYKHLLVVIPATSEDGEKLAKLSPVVEGSYYAGEVTFRINSPGEDLSIGLIVIDYLLAQSDTTAAFCIPTFDVVSFVNSKADNKVAVVIEYYDCRADYYGERSARAFVNGREISIASSSWDTVREMPTKVTRLILNVGDVIEIRGARSATGLREPQDDELKTTCCVDKVLLLQIDTTSKTVTLGAEHKEHGLLLQVTDYTIYNTGWRDPNESMVFGTVRKSGSVVGVRIFRDEDVYIRTAEKSIYLESARDIELNTPYGTVYANGQIISQGGCLAEGTLITMADGTKKVIEEVVPGDEVLSYDFENQKTVPAVVLFNEAHGRVTYTKENLFSDGSVLETYDEHFVYNVNGSACSDIQKWETSDAAMKADGTVVNWCGYVSKAGVAVRTFNLITSNNTYFASGILNSCWPTTKFRLAKLRKVEMPAELYEAVKPELGYHRNGTHKAGNAEFLAAVKDIEAQCTAVARSIAVNKKKLADSDYQMVKTCEAVNAAIMEAKDFDDLKKKVIEIYTQEFTKKVDDRKKARDAVKAIEDRSAELYGQVKAVKRQYGVWSEFEDMTTREQFMLCNKLGCQNLEAYRAWPYITNAKAIFGKKEQEK